MPERDLRRRRIPANRRATSNSRASPSPAARRRIRPSPALQILKSSKDVKILRRTRSEPLLWNSGGENMMTQSAVTAALGDEEEEDGGVIYRPQTCIDIFNSPEISFPSSPRNYPEGYNRDSKVVVNVTVEGSPGPIRTLVKLGCSVEETINLVINKYNEQCRTPYIHHDSASKCELHQSSFSLQSLSKSDLIGDVGCRSFYLRKSCESDHSRGDSSNHDLNELNASASLPFVPSFIDRKIKKIIRTSPKFLKFFGCIQCFG